MIVVSVWLLVACSKDPVADTDPEIDTDPGVDTEVVDADGDGSPVDADCDDTNAEVYPGATETFYDGVDQDCSGGSDLDADGDGVDSSAFGGADCDDSDPSVGFDVCTPERVWTAPDSGALCGLAVDDDNLYAAWQRGGEGRAYQVSRDGASATLLFTGASVVQGIEVAEDRVWFTEFFGALYDAPVGGGVVTEHVRPGYALGGVVPVGDTVYYAQVYAGRVMALTPSTGEETAVIEGMPSVVDIATDGTWLYWSDYISGTLGRWPLAGGEIWRLPTPPR